jgi:predicted ATPase
VTPSINPYAESLLGLDLDDPVQAFFSFCKERERIRVRREAGAPPPWTDDPIFQRGRFLNVFREDDRGSKAIRRFVEPVRDDVEALVHALLFARWCNRQATLDALSVDQLNDPGALRRVLETEVEPPWFNPTAYPVEPLTWQGVRVSRIDAATDLFPRIRSSLADAIRGAGGSIVRATDAINAVFGMSNDFPIFMAVVDVSAFRPDLIDPAGPVPTGIGAVAFLDRLQAHLGLDDHHQTANRMIELQREAWPDARRQLHPIDIEYLSCECRKYYSYINGTKTFTGKNLFEPGSSPMLPFDVPADAVPDGIVQTEIVVLAGGPCSGKSTLATALQAAGHRVEFETAERLLNEGIEAGSTAAELRADPVVWQMRVLEQDFALFDSLPPHEVVFTDTSFVEDRVYATHAGIAFGPTTTAWLRRRRYRTVFFLPTRPEYEQTSTRMESPEAAAAIAARVLEEYRSFGYEPVVVPAGTLEEQMAFVLGGPALPSLRE